MTISTVQTCNVCQVTRALGDPKNADNGGWREIQPGRHICPKCIADILRGKP